MNFTEFSECITVTRNITYLVIAELSVVVIQSAFSLLPLVR